MKAVQKCEENWPDCEADCHVEQLFVWTWGSSGQRGGQGNNEGRGGGGGGQTC